MFESFGYVCVCYKFHQISGDVRNRKPTFVSEIQNVFKTIYLVCCTPTILRTLHTYLSTQNV